MVSCMRHIVNKVFARVLPEESPSLFGDWSTVTLLLGGSWVVTSGVISG